LNELFDLDAAVVSINTRPGMLYADISPSNMQFLVTLWRLILSVLVTQCDVQGAERQV
jgi:hypothetical protein